MGSGISPRSFRHGRAALRRPVIARRRFRPVSCPGLRRPGDLPRGNRDSSGLFGIARNAPKQHGAYEKAATGTAETSYDGRSRKRASKSGFHVCSLQGARRVLDCSMQYCPIRQADGRHCLEVRTLPDVALRPPHRRQSRPRCRARPGAPESAEVAPTAVTKRMFSNCFGGIDLVHHGLIPADVRPR
jgi:hypothetical protein